MLTYFPTPYPGEWWYSVLCRYHVRSGNAKFQTTIRELIPGRITAAIGSVFPNSTIRQVLAGLPDSIINVEDVIIQNTLFPYYSRFSTADKKASVLSQLSRGETMVITSVRRFSAKSVPHYCPQCVKEDRQTYGEAYWHIEHQIPLMSICPKHGCQLQTVDTVVPSHLDYTFYPLESLCPGDIPCESPGVPPWQTSFSKILYDYQRVPLSAAANPKCNNLAISLANMGYGMIQSRSSHTILNAKKLYWDLIDTYGKEFVELIFGGESSVCIINRACKWEISSPERYALLQDFAGISTDVVFCSEPLRDRFADKLLTLQDAGGPYSKKQVQEELGVTASQLDILTRKYGIAPFWKQTGGERTSHIHITLTVEEKQRIVDAAALYGDGQTAVFARAVLLGEVDKILKSKSNTD